LLPDEVVVLVRHADDEQDGALFLVAAFTGLCQGELIALRWRHVDARLPGHHGHLPRFAVDRASVDFPNTGLHAVGGRSAAVTPAPSAADDRPCQRANTGVCNADRSDR
jgi:hypothetical protein